MRRLPVLLMLSLGLSTSAVLAQTAPAAAPPAATPGARAPATPAIAPAQQAQLAKQDADMTRAAQQVAQLVDAQQAGQVWDGASAVARKAVTREAFANSVNGDRNKLGALVSRGKPSITRVQYPAGAAVPEGIYLNVSFPTRFANNAQPVRELVSFRLDEDKVWRASGYSVRAAN
jgi:hypothetical protein